MDYRQEGNAYIENLRAVRALSKVEEGPQIDDDALLAQIQQNADKSFAYMKENNALLERLLFSRKPEELTDEDIEGLRDWAAKLFSYMASEDAPIAYKIHCLLLDAARIRKDDAMLVQELYYCGVTLSYCGPLTFPGESHLFIEKLHAYFFEGAGYMARYEEMDEETRGYIIRCVGNRSIGIGHHTLAQCREFCRYWDETMNIVTSPYYRDMNPKLPWDNFEYTMHMNVISLTGYLRDTKDPDPEIVQRVLNSAEYVYKNKFLYQSEEARLQSWRVEYFYLVALYHAGRGTSCAIVERLLDVIERTSPEDYSVQGAQKNLTMVSYMLNYRPKLSPPAQERLGPQMDALVQRSIQYLSNMPASAHPRVISNAVQMLADVVSELDTNSTEKVFDILLAGHKPTYIHSLMVAELTRALIRQQLKTAPETLLGLQGHTKVEQLQQHTEELCALAYECGVCHDLGKSMVLMYISMNARRLQDEEFLSIKRHPQIGCTMLYRMSRKEALAQAALHHHRFYDGTGGYPQDVPPCSAEIKGIVDAITVADSLDAATDGIGRCYTTAKPFEALLDEVRAQSGTRYSPHVAALFDDAEFCEQLKGSLYAQREKIYLSVYRNAQKSRAIQS